GEQCDDGGTEPGDGCSTRCRIEKDWACDANGRNCYYTVECGDGVVSGNEACDDGNTADGDGCAADCSEVEEGYRCPRADFPCRTICGDGIIAGNEQCDDADTESGDGCSATCTIELNRVCTGEPSVCEPTICG